MKTTIKTSYLKNLLYIAILAITGSCSSSEKSQVEEALTGNWLLVAPDHHLKNQKQREIYGKYQDSLISLFGLKLVSFGENGEFLQIDSIGKSTGKWMITADNKVMVRSGGKGFNDMAVDFVSFVDDKLQLLEMIPMDGDSIKIVWHLKKINEDDDGDKLFKNSSHNWRNKAKGPEDDKAIRERVVQMLNYYADYYELVSKESTYFSQSKVFLPFSYYQHGMGLRDFDGDHPFSQQFYNLEDALKAYHLLEEAMNALEDDFPSGGDNYVIEYSEFMRKMAKEIAR